MTKELSPSIRQFKVFLQSNPHVIKAIRSKEVDLQDCYEQFILLGEEDHIWEQYKERKTNKDDEEDEKKARTDDKTFSKWMAKINSLDLNSVEKHIHDLNGAIDQVVKVIDQYKQFTSGNNEQSSPVRDPFSFRMRD
ncbi:spore coat protein YlbD [Gracilibacillus oryzae]|uniref:spore coat protein YlbD n=1 Tax=Gracilibacillus oryzae TaxID=1672701 RepID=UPI001885D6EE|nr:spore coat protein YlbD [Gracilibacillus oryzae]